MWVDIGSGKDITWTNVNPLSVTSCVIHFRVISQELLKISNLDMSLKITNLILQPHLLGANELTFLASQQVNLVAAITFFFSFFLKLIVTCRFCVICVREDNYSNV